MGKNFGKFLGKMKQRGGAEDTDDEETDTPEARRNRRENLASLLEEIEAKKGNLDEMPKGSTSRTRRASRTP